MHRVLAVLLLAAACGGPSSSSPSGRTAHADDSRPAGPPPTLLGHPAWDGPLTDPMARRALERVDTAIADKPPVLEGTDPRMWLGPIQRWIEKRVALTQEVRADANALASDADPRMKLLASIVLAVAIDDFVTDLLSIEPPAAFVAGDFGAETRVVFKEQLEKQAAPLATSGRAMLQKCIADAPKAPEPLRVWEATCREHDARLGELEARVAARNAAPPREPVPKPPALFADCDTKEVRHVDPVAPPPDLKAKPAVAYVYDGTDVKGDDVPKLEQAVAAKLGLDVGMPVITDKEMAAARALVAQRKLHRRAPVCGQSPPLPAVIAHDHKNLILGEIETTCLDDGRTRQCGLLVRYTRAGSDDPDGLPAPVFSKVASRDMPAADWIAAADRLVPDERATNILGSLSGSSETSPIFLDLANYRDDDPWLRVASTLDSETRQRVASCVDAAGSFDATLTISPTGKTQKATLAPVTAPPAGSKLATCLQKALEATPWPCPPGGKSAKVAVRVCVAPRPK